MNNIKIEIIDLGYSHYGGAWKVAYADFVTAMMAFFLLMWLLNVTTKEQKNAISDYFSPSTPQLSDSKSGAGGLLGGLTVSPVGARSSNQSPLVPPQATQQRKRGGDVKSKVNNARKKAEEKRFKAAKEKIEEAIRRNPQLAKLKKNLLIDITPEGLRIQIVDQEEESMFPSGSANMFEKTKLLLEQITNIVLDMPNEISVRGHTDAARFSEGAKYTNWELSADRANASRRVMRASGMPVERLNNVMGKADTELFIQDNPLDARNRRITLILLKEELTEAFDEDEYAGEIDDEEDVIEEDVIPLPELPQNPFQKTPGAVEFP